jgi:adenylate cyclase
MLKKTKIKNKFSRIFSFLSPTATLVVVVTLVIAAMVIVRPMFSEILELKLYDLKMRLRGPRPPGPEIVIIAIDDASLRRVGRWPWSREVMGKLLTRLKEGEPRIISLDIIFAERQETALLSAMQDLRREISLAGGASPKILKLLEEKERLADADKQLAQVLLDGPPTVLGFYFRDLGNKFSLKSDHLIGESVPDGSTYNLVRWREGKPSSLPLMAGGEIETNLPELSAAAAGAGYFNMVPDSDGTVRWLPQAIVHGHDIFASLSLVTAQLYLGHGTLGLTMSRSGVEEVRLGSRLIPVDRLGRLLINYLGPSGKFTSYSAADVLAGSLPAGALKDKIVMMGATAVGIYDLRVTPFSGVYPGIEIQATLVDNLIHNQFLQTARTPDIPLLIIVLGLGLLLGAILPRLNAVRSSIITVGLVDAYCFINYFLFSRWNWQLELFYPLLMMGTVYTGVTVQRFLAEERERQRVKMAFQSYVAPDVVNEILKHPERLRLGGERRDISVLFSDIRGFTSLSETLEPEALVNLLHDFLNPMSEIIVTNGGTIDKYIGDAIMALFGAPLDRQDHSILACRTALRMSAKLKDLSREWKNENRPSLQIGIGINSGSMAVGNMGSNRLFNYTAMGDNVNLASRLEGLNKYYGTEILISAATAQNLDNQFVLREVDLVRVKGKKQPLVIYELLGEGEPDAEIARFLTIYEEGRSQFRSRQFRESAAAFAKALELRPQDIPSRHFLERAQEFQITPPKPDWQGVRVMQEK